MFEFFVEPWREPILRAAMLELLFVGVACGALGVWIMLYGLAYSAESLAHGMFPGLVIAALVGAPLILGGAAGLLVAGVAIAAAARLRGVGADNAVAVVITTLFGIGALLALAPASPAGLQELLFGDVLASSRADLWLSGGLAVLVLAGMWLAHWRLLTVGFDPGAARALGIPPLRVELALLVLLAVAVLIGVQGLGNLLVVALVLAPAAAALSLVARLAAALALSVLLAALAGVAGLLVSYHLELAAGASVALCAVALAGLALLVPRAGRLTG